MLTGEILRLVPETDRREAEKFSTKAVDVASMKSEEWGVDLNPWLHNGLVNLGFKPAGLCYEWANVLYGDLEEVLPQGLKMTLVQSRPRSIREHHAISLHGAGRAWSDGLLLDGWEQAGVLVFMPIGESERVWQYEAERPYYVRPRGSVELPTTSH